jgi:hypothetical protein
MYRKKSKLNKRNKTLKCVNQRQSEVALHTSKQSSFAAMSSSTCNRVPVHEPESASRGQFFYTEPSFVDI